VIFSPFVKNGPEERVNVAGTLRRLLRASPNAEYSLSCARSGEDFFLWLVGHMILSE
jgi:hypothetical protein